MARASAATTRDARVVAALALATAALAWVMTVRQARGMRPGAAMPLPAFLAAWVVMMTAMMLPSVVPVATLWLRTVRGDGAGGVSRPV